MFKKIINWRTGLGVLLIIASAVLYYVHFRIFHDAYHIFIYLMGDIAFVPVEVLLVTLVIHNLLEKRSKRILLKKMNMLIGAFFSEIGTPLLRIFSGFDKDIENLRTFFADKNIWTNRGAEEMKARLKEHTYRIDVRNASITELADFLRNKNQFLLNLLSNSNLLEHASFTELLWAVFHLTEELMCRETFEELPDPDKDHLSGDIKRAYHALASEWLNYMRHLKREYPYLFSLALRKNPFDLSGRVVIDKFPGK
ncbi:MAG: hypothetical protein KKG84_06375 [Candidatus Omnitrophica bacterium]|nr:hypothetical protein [Candidatus Omnitrophota bacterium]